MQVTINGEAHSLPKTMPLSNLLTLFELDPVKVAIEHNLEIIHMVQFDQVWVNDGDNIEIIHFIGGG